jgi:hypothetical protein
MPLNLGSRIVVFLHRALGRNAGSVATRAFQAFPRKKVADRSLWVNIEPGESLIRLRRGENLTVFIRKAHPASGKWATITDVFDTHTRES